MRPSNRLDKPIWHFLLENTLWVCPGGQWLVHKAVASALHSGRFRRSPGMVRFVGVRDIVRLVSAQGVEAFLTGLAAYIEEDFRRWPEFEKIPRVASHSQNGVIELMPVS